MLLPMPSRIVPLRPMRGIEMKYGNGAGGGGGGTMLTGAGWVAAAVTPTKYPATSTTNDEPPCVYTATPAVEARRIAWLAMVCPRRVALRFDANGRGVRAG